MLDDRGAWLGILRICELFKHSITINADDKQGIMITTVAITAYCLDSYPEGSGEVVRQSDPQPSPLFLLMR